MSRGVDGTPPGYEVGYGKPPAAHRFKKGVSGNPRGRPRKKVDGLEVSPLENQAIRVIQAEASRLIKVRENDRDIEITAFAAVTRKMLHSALKGSVYAQARFVDLVQGAEAERSRQAEEAFREAVEYKAKWARRFEECREQGLPLPEPVPHPDHIILDVAEGTFRIFGPRTREEKRESEKLIAEWRDALADSDRCLSMMMTSGEEEKPAWIRKFLVAGARIQAVEAKLPGWFDKSEAVPNVEELFGPGGEFA